MKNVIELLESTGISPRRASSFKGGEYHSPCPGCGGDDRFHVWPEQNDGQGSYWCRQCGKGGDAIQFLIDFDGLSYPEACRALDVDLPKKEQFGTPRVKSQGKGAAAGWQASSGERPAGLWLEKADKLVGWANEKLLENKSQMRWLLERGILKKAVEKYKLGWIPEDMWRPRKSWGLPDEFKKDGKAKKLWIPSGLVIPRLKNGRADRIRIRRPAGEPRFWAIMGSNMDCMVLHEPPEVLIKNRLALVVESELDAILMIRFVFDLAVVIALGNSSRKPDAAAAQKLSIADLILFAIDYDKPGNNQVPWWQEHFARSKHWPVPAGKDPGEAFKQNIDLRAWVIAGCPKGWFVEPSLLGVHPDPPAAENKAERCGMEPPAGVVKLKELLKNTPVMIINTDNRTTITSPRRWSDKNWEKSKQISNLVYFNPEVFEWIGRHPDEKITGDNLIDKEGKHD